MIRSRKKYIYEIINTLGTVEYVGETFNPKRRFYEHTKLKPCRNLSVGRFYKRQDLFMNIVDETYDSIECYRIESTLKCFWGLQPTEHLTRKNNGIKSCAKAIIAVNLTTGESFEFYGLQNACKTLNINLGEGGRVARGIRKHTKGYYLEYK